MSHLLPCLRALVSFCAVHVCESPPAHPGHSYDHIVKKGTDPTYLGTRAVCLKKVPCSCEQDEQVCIGLSCYCCSPAWHLSLPACTVQIVKLVKGEATDHGHLTHIPWGKVALQLNPYQNQKINSQRPKICKHAGNAERYVCFLS